MLQQGKKASAYRVKEPIVKTSASLFFDFNRKGNIDDPVIISYLTFTAETNM